MTLQERFDELDIFDGEHDYYHDSQKCVELADEHAINFAEWVKNSSIKNTDLPINVLLKMYENQKGL